PASGAPGWGRRPGQARRARGRAPGRLRSRGPRAHAGRARGGYRRPVRQDVDQDTSRGGGHRPRAGAGRVRGLAAPVPSRQVGRLRRGAVAGAPQRHPRPSRLVPQQARAPSAQQPHARTGVGASLPLHVGRRAALNPVRLWSTDMGPASPPTRRTQRERREHTESALLTAAAELVVERGVLAVTLANVAERAGYSRGIVTHQFGTKGAMLRALAHASQAGFVPGLTDVPPGADRLLRIIDGYLGQLADIAVMNRAFLVLWAESATTPELTPIFRERDAAFRADLRADVEAAIAEGAVR